MGMNEKKEWKYCVVGNIVKTHIDDAGILRNGTPAYRGGAKVYLCGKYWSPLLETITVIGLSRGKHFYVHDVPANLIENVRCSRVYNPAIVELMDDWEFHDCWWQNTLDEKKATEIFVAQWKEMRA